MDIALPRHTADVIVWKIFRIIVMLGTVFFAAATPCFAQVVINEVFPAPSSGHEWIEYANIGTEPVAIGGWQVWDELTTPNVLMTLPTGDTMQPGELRVLEISNKLNNGGDGVILKDGNGTIITSMAFTASTTDQSWARTPDGTGNFSILSPTPGAWNTGSPPTGLSTGSSPTPQPSASPSPSPSGTPSPTPVPSASPTPLAAIRITEVVACPESGGHEWIELYNAEAVTIALVDWKFIDRQNNTRLVSVTLPSRGYEAINLSTSMLNNDGDTLELRTPTNTPIDSVELPACQKGQSYARLSDGWRFTTLITRGIANTESDEPSGVMTNMPGTTTSPIAALPTPYPSSSSILSASSPTVDAPKVFRYMIPALAPDATSAAGPKFPALYFDGRHSGDDVEVGAASETIDAPTVSAFPFQQFSLLSPLLLTNGGGLLFFTQHHTLKEWWELLFPK